MSGEEVYDIDNLTNEIEYPTDFAQLRKEGSCERIYIYKTKESYDQAVKNRKNGQAILQGKMDAPIRCVILNGSLVPDLKYTINSDGRMCVSLRALSEAFDSNTDYDTTAHTLDGTKYWYSFSATKEKVCAESLYHAPKGQKALVFSRSEQVFSFTEEKARRKLISQIVAENQLFFSVACTMNDEACSKAMIWFREMIYFSRDYSDIPRQLLEYSNDTNMLKAISNYAKAADVGIEDMRFEINSKKINERADLPENIPDEDKTALVQFMHLLSETSSNAETHLRMGQVTATSIHQGEDKSGNHNMYSIELADESDGTRKLMALAPAIESVLSKGGLLLIDGIEKDLHPALVEFIIAKFQSKKTNPKGAQLIFTTHNTELLSMELLRKDQLYFVDKHIDDGTSELYSISTFSTRTTDNIRKGYLLGKYGAIPDIEIEQLQD